MKHILYVSLLVLTLLIVGGAMIVAANAMQAAPVGVHVVKDASLASRVLEACGLVLRNPTAGILYVVPYTANDGDRVCIQQADRESLKCQPVRDMRRSWGADAGAK